MNLVTRMGGAAALALFSIACASEPAPAPPATTAAAPATVAAAPPAAAAPVAAGDEVGVPECDSFLKKYYACVNSNVPEQVRPSVRQSVDALRASWKQAVAAAPQAKAGLATGCAQAEASAKQSMAQYNCTW